MPKVKPISVEYFFARQYFAEESRFKLTETQKVQVLAQHFANYREDLLERVFKNELPDEMIPDNLKKPDESA